MDSAADRQLACVIVADDLTGSCDAGIHFAAAGLTTAVRLNPFAPEYPAEVLVFNTASRSQAVPESTRRVHNTVVRAPDAPILYKKIDSTLQGHIHAELEAALAAGSRASAVFAPAYPDMGRVVRNGMLYVHEQERRELRTVLGPPFEIVPDARSASAFPRRVYAPDIESGADLDRLAAESLPFADSLLLAGSGGFAKAIAAAIGPGPGDKPSSAPRRSGRIVVFHGSRNPATLCQLEALRAAHPDIVYHDVRLEHGYGPLHYWRSAAFNARAILFCGGETAQLVCAGLRIDYLLLMSEIVPGLPWSVACGGPFSGLPVATKAGGFGNDNALVDAASFFYSDS